MIDILVGKKVIGIKQASKAIKNGRGTVLYVAKDADKKINKSINRISLQY